MNKVEQEISKIENQYKEYGLRLGKNEDIAETYGVLARNGAREMTYGFRDFLIELKKAGSYEDIINMIDEEIKHLEEAW